MWKSDETEAGDFISRETGESDWEKLRLCFTPKRLHGKKP